MVPFRKIVVSLDGSELAENALAPAMAIAGAMASRAGGEPVKLILLRVVGPVALVAADPLLYDELMRMGIDEAQAYLNTVVASLKPERVTVEAHAATGSATGRAAMSGASGKARNGPAAPPRASAR